jgi:hypothetical protein
MPNAAATLGKTSLQRNTSPFVAAVCHAPGVVHRVKFEGHPPATLTRTAYYD